MKLTNKKTGESYEVSTEAGEKILKSDIGKRFKGEKPVEVPAEIKYIKPVKEKVRPVPVEDMPAEDAEKTSE